MKSIVEMGRSDVSGELIEAYRSEGVVKVPNLISTGCAAEIRKEAVTNLGDAGSLFSIAPELEYAPKVTMPLKAGDATFHNGRMAHMATANQTEEWRIAHVIIYMQKGTRYSGRPHVVTGDYKHEGGELQPGDELTQEWFPCVADTQ